MRRVVIFGAGLAGERAHRRLCPTCHVVAFADNAETKWGRSLCGVKVVDPRQLARLNYDAVIVASAGAMEICRQLAELGVPAEKVDLDLSPPDESMHEEWKQGFSNEIRRYRDKHAGQDCFILGNGPSLSKVDCSLLADRYTFGLNKIHLLFERSSFRPTYHVAVNQLVIKQSIDAFRKLPCPSFLSYAAAKTFGGNGGNIRYLYTSHTHAFSRDVAEIVSEGATVTYVAMQLAWYMGFENVFLIGVDHRFGVRGTPHERRRMKGPDSDHFDPAYFAGLEWQLPDLVGSEFSYRQAKKAFERSLPPRAIFDATSGGALEVFPKLSVDEALRRSRPMR